MRHDDVVEAGENLGHVACELAETLEGMSLYAQRLATTPECPRSMASELQLIRVALHVCIARADVLANSFDSPDPTGTAG